MSPLLPRPPPRPPPAACGEDLSEDEGIDRAVMKAGDEFDALGFAVPDDGDSVGESFKSYQQWFQAKAMRRLKRLEVRQTKLRTPGDWTSIPKPALKALLRKGLPPEHRPEIWWSCLGCEAQRQRSPVAYQDYLKERLELSTAETIERDLPRTFPNHKKFRSAAGRSELRNVLHAFARRWPSVQYCQGLNFIAGLLLVVLKDEERAFWALVCAMDALGVEGYYTEGMALLRADMGVLAIFMKQRCSKVANELQRLNIDLLSICSEWYLTWFAKSMPISTVLRVWDTLFFEGFKVLFRVAMGVFKKVENEVLECGSFDGVMEKAKRWPRTMVEHNELLKISFGGYSPFRRRDLLKARDEALVRIEREDEQHRREAQARREANNKARAAASSTAPPPSPPALSSSPLKVEDKP